MLQGVPRAARWVTQTPRRTVPPRLVERIAQGRRVANWCHLGDGLRNGNFKIEFPAPSAPVVLRIYEQDPCLCRKELDLLRLVRGVAPVPDVQDAEPDGWDGLPPFAVLQFVNGITFRELKRAGDAAATAQAAHGIGRALARIGSMRLPQPGWIGPGPSVDHPPPTGIDFSGLNLRSRLDPRLRDATEALLNSVAGDLAAMNAQTHLVHGDFGMRNVLVRQAQGKWSVAAILDWEFAVSGCPLADIGHFLRFEREDRPICEPHFSQGYRDEGGTLPGGWRRLAQVIDLVALCGALSVGDLPDWAETELVELVRRTVGDYSSGT